jgi:oligopeptide transport system ATP-binding protein
VSDLVLEARDLVRYFRSRAGLVRAVDGVDLRLRRGETLGVVGESGCGKSTLAKLLVGLEKPTSGTVVVRDEDLSGLRGRGLRRARRHIQMVMQDPYTSLNPRMTVGDIVGEPFRIHPDVVPRAGRGRAVRDLLDVVGLNPDHIGRYPHQFSGGQRQRIGIARALALRPDIIVCDEPVSALDVSVQAQVINLLVGLQRDLGLAYVFIAHDLSVVQHISARVAVMYLGKVVETGENEAIYSQPAHPYTRALLSAVPIPDPRFRAQRNHILLEGDVPSPVSPPGGCRFRTRCWKAQPRCAAEEPALLVAPGAPHPTACHFPEGPG